MSIFFTSDIHFGHNNIIEYCSRPWKDVEDMDEGLIKNFNSVVGPEDTTYIIGDISFHKTATTKYLLSRLNGRLVGVKGNHDPEGGYEGCFKEWNRDFIGKIDKQMFHMYHFPLSSWYHMNSPYDKTIHLHGHIHSAPGLDDPTQCKFDVGVDANNWTPVSMDHIMAEAVKRRENRAKWLEKQRKSGNPVSTGYHRRPNASQGV